MTEIIPNEAFVTQNYDKICDLVAKNDEIDSPLSKMIAFLGDRYALCPASANVEYYSAFPGGLIYHTLHLLQWVGRFANLMAPNVYQKNTLLKISILSEIGKVGDLNDDYFIPTTTKWQKDKGFMYEINPKVSYMRMNQRCLYLAKEFNIPLSSEEYVSILLSDKLNDDNESYRYKEPDLALILQNANQWSQRLESKNIIQYV